MRQGFTLVELIIAVVIVGILFTFALPQFAVTKERALDKEAKSILALIQAAEKIYKMEFNSYYPPSGSTNVIDNINTNLKVDLSSASSWSYTLDTDNSQATAGRLPSGRVWTLPYTGINASTATCSGTGCPP